MTEAEEAREVLQWFYDTFHKRELVRSPVEISPDEFGGRYSHGHLLRLVRRLMQDGLVEAGLMSTGGPPILAYGITADGVDAVQGTTRPGSGGSVHNDNRRFSIGTSYGPVQQGDHNWQDVAVHVQSLIEAVKAAEMPEEERRGLLAHLRAFLSHPAAPFVVPTAGDLLDLLAGS